MRAQRNPEKKDDDMMNAKPTALKVVSPATIIVTPMIITTMIRMSFRFGDSRRKRKANSSTKPNTELLHMV